MVKTMLRARAEQLLRARIVLWRMALVSGLSVGASALGFVFQIVLAAHFGAGTAIDSYLFTISAPMFLAGLGAAALSYAGVPALVHADHDPILRTSLLRVLRRRVVIVAVIVAMLGLPAMTVQRLLLPQNADLRLSTLLPWMLVLGWATGGVQLFTALFTVELNAARRPVTAALLVLPPNIGAIAIVALNPDTILSASVGVLLGSLAAALLGTVLTRPAFRIPPGEVRTIGSQTGIEPGRMGLTIVGMSCFSAYAVIDAFWAPRGGSGLLASLGYAQRLVVGIGSLLLVGPSAVLTPRFAVRLRDGGGAMFLREVRGAVLIVGTVAVTCATLLAIVAEPLIGAAFGRGAFDARDIERVATVVRFMMPGFAAMLVSVVLTRAIYCLTGVERPMAIIGLGWSGIYFIACGLLLPLGGSGFGIGYSAAWLIYMLIATFILRRYAARNG